MEIDTISAIATAPGSAGVGIVRVSGPKAHDIAKQIVREPLKPRHALYSAFYSLDSTVLDRGIALYFPGPHSYTGEDTLELQAHGGAVILDLLLKETLNAGARLARPGEFSQRAFLNDKIDLVQAEAIADIINCSSETAVRAAMRSLSGDFSRQIDSLVEKTIALRVYVESSIDFPDEEIDLVSDQFIANSLEELQQGIDVTLASARQGSVLREGATLTIIGKPNAGKSTLLNFLANNDRAIVSAKAGTTRDIIKEDIHLDGLPLRIIDTAGIRKSNDEVEIEGIRRAKQEIEKADILLLLVDMHSTTPEIDTSQAADKLKIIEAELRSHDIVLPENANIIIANNKIDLANLPPAINEHSEFTEVFLSLKSGEGTQLLCDTIKRLCGYNSNTEGNFVARRRHLLALENASKAIAHGTLQLQQNHAGELLAEDLLQAQQQLGEITGKFSSDDLLGEIFSSFCIGK